jgi:hypothetical protein
MTWQAWEAYCQANGQQQAAATAQAGCCLRMMHQSTMTMQQQVQQLRRV